MGGLIASFIGSFLIRNILTGGLSAITDRLVSTVVKPKTKLVLQGNEVVNVTPEPKPKENSTTRDFSDIVLSLGFWYQIAVLANDTNIASLFGTYSGFVALVIGVFIKYYRWKTDEGIAY